MKETAENLRNTGKYRSTVIDDNAHDDERYVMRKRIAELRLSNRLSQSDVAEILGVKQRTYCQYELGEAKIPVGRLIVLARYYDVSMDYLTGITDEPEKCPANKGKRRVCVD